MAYLSEKQVQDFCYEISKELNDIVFNNIYNYLRENPDGRNHLNPAFPFPKQLRIGILENYLVVEYVGPSEDDKEEFKTYLEYRPDKNLYDFLDIDIAHLNSPTLPYDRYIHNMNFFLGDSIDYLTDYFYDFTQCPEDFCLNGFLDISGAKDPCLINNCTFFWSDEFGRLKIRHIDLLEFFPFTEEGVSYHSRDSLLYFSNYIIWHKFPKYKVEMHKLLNQFIQLINTDASEIDITTFIENNPEILQIPFGLYNLNPQMELKWQYGTARKNLKPDFLPTRMDGFCDIFEFKLPNIKSKPIVGGENRQHPSYEIDKAISKINEYEEWFEQEINREWLNKT